MLKVKFSLAKRGSLVLYIIQLFLSMIFISLNKRFTRGICDAMKTFSLKKGDIEKNWVLFDAEGLVLGRLASEIAKILIGKNKPTYTPHMDCGDNVIVINAEKVALTGQKLNNKVFHWHTNYPGGLKTIKTKEILEGKHPERVLQLAVKRMLPKGPLGYKQLKNLRLYVGDKHPHSVQNPVVQDFRSRNRKNYIV